MTQEKTIEELRDEYSKYSYQWIKGDNISLVQHYANLIDDNGRIFLCFTDGSRIDINLIDEYMMFVEKGFEEKAAMRSSAPQLEMFIDNPNTGVRSRNFEQPKPVEQKPIFALLSKQKENWVDVDLKLSINLPSRTLWDVLMSSFDNADVDILEFVTKDLDIEVVRESLRSSIKEIYNLKKNNTSKNVRSQDNISE